MKRLSGGGSLPQKPSLSELQRGFFGGFISILGLAGLSTLGHPFLMAPFGATCVILFAASAAPFAQPRNVIGGHLVSVFVGLVALFLLGDGIFSMALAVGLAIASMQYLRVVHPPAGANPLVVIMAGSYGFDFMIFPVLLGSIFLVGVASIINNLGKDKKWPVYWYGISRN